MDERVLSLVMHTWSAGQTAMRWVTVKHWLMVTH